MPRAPRHTPPAVRVSAQQRPMPLPAPVISTVRMLARIASGARRRKANDRASAPAQRGDRGVYFASCCT